MKIALITLYDEYCLGARYLSSVLAKDGHEPHIVIIKGLDYVNPFLVPEPPEQDADGYYGYCSYVTGKETQILLDTLEKIDPGWIGFSFLGINFGLACFLTAAVRKRFPKRPILWGGADTTINPEDNVQHADVICCGEGEEAVCEFTHKFERGEDFSDIQSLWIRDTNGEIKRNPKRLLERDLDKIPWPDFEPERKYIIHDDRLIENHFPPSSHLHTNFMIMGTRGCPFTCTYCHSGHSDVTYPGDKFVRSRTAGDVVGELKHRIKTWPTKIERVEFLDDILPLNFKWVEKLAPLYKEEIGLPFYGYTHPNVSRPDTLKLLSEAGCQYLIMGIQSGSQRTLTEYYHRKHSKEKVIQATQNMIDAGIRPVIDLIGYNPLETEKDNLETLDLLCELPRPYGLVKINPMAFYDDFRILDIAEREGVMDRLERPKGVHAYQAKHTSEFLFWEMLHTLAQFDGFTDEALVELTRDKHLREHPEFMSELVTVLYQTTYMDSNPVSPKDEYIESLRQRVHHFESSTVYKAYRKLRHLRGTG